MRIGLDFHGVITENPLFFKKFAATAIKCGHEIHVISGGSTSKLEKYLGEWDIKYTDTFSLVDYFRKTGRIEYVSEGDFKVSDELWDTAKAQYCRENKIGLQIDDTPRYRQYFTTPFGLYNPQDQTCSINGKTIDMSTSAPKALAEIANALSVPVRSKCFRGTSRG